MKYNFLIVDKITKEELTQLNFELGNVFYDYEIVYATANDNFFNEQINNVTIYKLDKEYSQDEILNRIIPRQECDNLVIVRKYNGSKEVIETAKKLTRANQIVVNTKPKNKFAKFIQSVINSLIFLIFHYRLYCANLSSMAFGNNSVKVMKTLSTPSALTKINRWTGMEIVEAIGGTKVDFNAKIITPIVLITVSVIVFCGTIILWALLPGVFSGFFIKLFAVFIMIMAIFFAFTYSLKLYILKSIGKNEDNRANLI